MFPSSISLAHGRSSPEHLRYACAGQRFCDQEGTKRQLTNNLQLEEEAWRAAGIIEVVGWDDLKPPPPPPPQQQQQQQQQQPAQPTCWWAPDGPMGGPFGAARSEGTAKIQSINGVIIQLAATSSVGVRLL